MKITVTREVPVPPAIKAVFLELTAEEAVDLRRILGPLSNCLKFGKQTSYDLYTALWVS